MEDLKARCDLLNESMVNAIKGRDEKLLSTELKESIGRLVKCVRFCVNFGDCLTEADARGIHDTFRATVVEYSTGIVGYVMVEDNSEAVKEANRKVDQILQCFWVNALLLSQLLWLMAML